MAKAEPPESSVRPAAPGAPDEGDRPALRDIVGREAYARYERTLETLGGPERAAVVARIERGQEWGEVGRALGGVSEDQARTTVCRAILELSGTTPAVAAEGTALSTLVRAVAERASVDWDGELRRAADEREREVVRQIRIIDDLARFRARPGSEPARTLPHDRHRYQIIGKLGAGGMGVVYRAEDLTLKRPVALKIITGALHEDEQARARFLREARTAASLNHPNVCAIYDFGEVQPGDEEFLGGGERLEAGTPFISMELVEGRTLAALLRKPRPIRFSETIDMAIQVAGGLAAAHAKGVVHRDLKPGNVMVSPEGKVKILDFGLAKPVTALAPDTTGTTKSLPRDLTAEGRIVGTVAYMSPEQVMGLPLDSRSDVFSFGTMLYEMATGKHPFTGDTPASMLGKILEAEPESLTNSAPASPPELDDIVRRCLRKRPDERYNDTRDLVIALEELRQKATSAAQGVARRRAGAEPAGTGRRGARLTAITVTALTAAFLGGLVVWLAARQATGQPIPVRRVQVYAGTGVKLCPDSWTAGGIRTNLALSPDGRFLAFHGHGDAWSGLYLKALDQDDAVRLEGTEGGESPAFSPDGRWLVFWAHGEIKKVLTSGGPAVRLCATGTLDVPPFGISVGDDGSVVYAIETGGLWKVSSEGGIPQPITQLRPGETSHRMPFLLPGGRAVMFTARKTGFVWGHEEIVVESLDTHERKVVLDHGADARFVAPGHVVFMDLGKLAAVPFDPVHLAVTGSEAALVPDVAQAVNEVNTAADSGAGQFSVSASGDLAYVRSPGGIVPIARRVLAWVDRRGVVTPVPMPEKPLRQASLAPDGQRVAMPVAETTHMDVWVFELSRGTWSRLTEGVEAWHTLWSPDGRELMIGMGDGSAIRWPTGAGGTRQEVIAATNPHHVGSWSRENVLALIHGPDYARFDINVMDLTAPGALPRPFVSSSAAEVYPEFSPDGHWLAYVSDESGRPEVYVLPYPGPGARVQVSTEGGGNPIWNPSGRELFYIAGDRTGPQQQWMTAADVAQNGSRLEVGRSRPLFAWPDELRAGASFNAFSVAPDGQRFLAIKDVALRPTPSISHIDLVQNWLEELKAKVPATRQAK